MNAVGWFSALPSSPPASRRIADFAEQAVKNARALEVATLWPFVVQIHFRPRVSYFDGTSQIEYDGAFEPTLQIVQAPLGKPPEASDYIPANAVPGSVRADIFPVSRFDDMAQALRSRYTGAYREYLMWRKANALQVSRAALRPWVDYDAILIDGVVARWVNGGQNTAELQALSE